MMASQVESADISQTLNDLSHERPVLTPPTSEDWNKNDGSDLSDLELENDEEEIEPDHYWDGGEIPVFKPTMAQFRSFKDFVAKIDKYGMKSGIVKVIPPKEWIDSLPALDQAVKSIRVKNPITQEFAGTHGTYTQANIEKQRSYNLPQWKALTEESQHQPPARRGERRKNTEKPSRPPPRNRTAPPVAPVDGSAPAKRKPGRPRKNPLPLVETAIKEEEVRTREESVQGPLTPTSPESIPNDLDLEKKKHSFVESPIVERQEKQTKAKAKGVRPRGKASQPKSVSERRKYNRREVAGEIDEAAFEGFDYRMQNKDEFSAERCAELETLYWKSLTFAPPMYGADMPGSLFDETTTSWNVAKLENILDILGQNVPGVNTAYLYLGMWKATYAWHLEDVDLYSINYIHFGAPKQWYSISQEDARRFENAMKSIWPTDAKNCSQFLRHKTYLISPAVLQSQFNIKVNKLVHNEGEFVITFPYGYHSGYNLGYNCAESVNFATEAWLDYGKIAKKCDCEADSVWIDVEDIERKLRGEPTPEYYEETDDELDDYNTTDLPSPPASVIGKAKPGRKRKREQSSAVPQKAMKKIRIRLQSSYVEPCVLCPNDMPFESLLQTDTGRYAHRVCALYTPETYLQEEDGIETICGIGNIDKARLDLKCSFCRSKKGACFQCCSKKCTRSFHATCAAAAGVQVDFGPVPVYGEDGTEYASEAYDFRCKFHRSKRSKNVSCDSLETDDLIIDFAKSLEPNHVIQMQYPHGDVFAGVVIENRQGERAVLVNILPEGDQIEVEWKYILTLDPSDSQLPKVSTGAKPVPLDMIPSTVQARNLGFGPPQADDVFGDPQYPYKWAEFHNAPQFRNPVQVKIDFAKPNQIWHYLGKTSTEAKAQFTENAAVRRHNAAGNFLDTVKPVSAIVKRQPVAPYNTPGINYHAINGVISGLQRQNPTLGQPVNRFYDYQSQKGYTPPYGGLQYDAQRASMGPGNRALMPRSESVATAPMYPNRPYSSTAWHQTQPGDSYPAPNGSVAQRRPSLADILRTPSEGQRTGSENERKPEQQIWKQRPAGMLPMADLLGTPDPTPESEFVATISAAEKEYLTHLEQYPYLRNSYLRRPKVYQSPYSDGGGYSSLYAVADSTIKSAMSPLMDSSPTPPPLPFTAPMMQQPVASYPPMSRYSYDPPSRLQPAQRSFMPFQYQSSQAFQQQVKREAAQVYEQKDIYNNMFDQIRMAGTAPMTPLDGHQQYAQSYAQPGPGPGPYFDNSNSRAQRILAASPQASYAAPNVLRSIETQAPAPLPPAM